MKQKKQSTLIRTIVALALLIILVTFAGRFELKSFFYPKPLSMPPVVSETIEELLARFQTVLEKRAPVVLQSLQPGLSENQISELEKKGSFTLSPDLHALYRWRNGSKEFKNVLIPGQRFLPLEEVVSERTSMNNDLKTASLIQRAFYYVFAGYRKTWVHILDDGAGDGYFYDPSRSGKTGVFFYHFAETGDYIFFPSLRNFLKGAIDCYEREIFAVKDGGVNLDENPFKARKVWNSLGYSNTQ
jgi:hypothetical protein